MKYAFRWRERAVRQLRAIPQAAALTVLRALTPLGDDPRRQDADIKKLIGYTDRYRLRVGDYQVIYEIADGPSSSFSSASATAARPTAHCPETRPAGSVTFFARTGSWR